MSGITHEVTAASKHAAGVDLRFQERLPQWMTEYGAPAVGIAVIEEGKLKEAKVFGELRKGVPAADNALFEVASLTKPVTAMTLLRLVNAGQWDLDEPLCHYWIDPDLKDDPRHEQLTARLALSHQTGFLNWRWLYPDKKLAFRFDPGTQYQYSGEGLEYLRQAVETKFAQPLEKIAEKWLFDPLGMADTRYFWDDTLDRSRFATRLDAEGNLIDTQWTGGEAHASYGLLTTLEDYGKFGADVINGGGLSPELFAEMTRPHIVCSETGGFYFGLGWELATDIGGSGEYALRHSGSDPGISTWVMLFPESKRGLVVMCNANNVSEIHDLITLHALDVGEELLERAKRY